MKSLLNLLPRITHINNNNEYCDALDNTRIWLNKHVV